MTSTAGTGFTSSSDGVRIAFTACGDSEPTLVFIHGGLANRGFWHHQVDGLASRYGVVALDLAGHGESGRDRTAWSVPQFAEDVRAVVEHLGLTPIVLIGNSLGGPVALESAALLRQRTLGVIGVDTLHDATQTINETDARVRAEAFARDPAGSCRAMVDQLFHPGQQIEVRAWAEREMLKTPPAVTVPMLASFAGYDMPSAFVRAGVPIRAINGDLWPTDIARTRTIAPDFDAVIMKGTGHYPMLEQPDAFNRLLAELVIELAGNAA
jgi:pimeloyl-ACP methyl ester carboxylesterase